MRLCSGVARRIFGSLLVAYLKQGQDYRTTTFDPEGTRL